MGKIFDSETGVVSDYCFLNGSETSRLSDVERLTLLGGAGLDRLVGRLGRSLSSVSLDVFAPGLNFEQLKSDHEKLSVLRQEGALAKLFERSSLESAPSVVPIHGFPRGGVFDLEFHSTFPGQNWTIDPSYNSLIKNQTSYVRLWEHEGNLEERKTIVAIHGWTMGDQRVNSLAFLPGLFYSLGFNVALFELPFHGRRRPEGIDPSDPLFPNPDPVRTCVGMAHAVHDLRTLKLFLESRGHREMSVIGMSLGAYVGLLWCALDTLSKGVFLVPLVSMGDMAFDLLRKQYRNGDHVPDGLTKAFLRDLFNDHFPLVRAPSTSIDRILVIGGEGDHLVPRNQISLLRERWGGVTISWVPGGHAAATQGGRSLELVRDFLLKTN